MKKILLIAALIGLALPGLSSAGYIITASDFTEGQSSAVFPLGLGSATASPRPFGIKYLSPDFSDGVGIQGGDVNNEIDGNGSETITVNFNQPTLIKDLLLGFLFPPGSGYGDAIHESAKVVAITADGQVLERYLTADGCTVSVQCEPGSAPTDCIESPGFFSDTPIINGYTPVASSGGPCFNITNCTGSWTGPGNQYGIVTNSSPGVFPHSGIWDVNNPFGPVPIVQLVFSANVRPNGPQDLGNSDFALHGISVEVPGTAVSTAAAAGTFSLLAASEPQAVQITIDKNQVGLDCSKELIDFPLLVEIAGEATLRHSSHGGGVQSATGDDIIFTDAAQNQLAHELESYDGATGSLIAWVKIPKLSVATDTVVLVGSGSSTNASVWDSSYKAVYHLNQPPQTAGKIKDSTLNGLDLTPQSGNPDSNRVAGQVGYGLKFRGWDYLMSAKNLSLSGGKFTIESWVRSDSYWGGRQALVSIQNGNTHGSRTLTSVDFPAGLGIQSNYETIPPTYRIANRQPSNTWVHIVARYDGSKLEGFVNGIKTQFTAAPGWGGVNGPVTLGVWRGETGWLNGFLTQGYLDEVRISDSARDSCWIETSYNNQSNPSAFYSIGPAQ